MSNDKIKQFTEKAISAFVKSRGHPGRVVRLGRFSIDYVPGAGVWVYESTKDGEDLLVFASSHNNRHADFIVKGALTDAQEAFLRYLILEELADV